jgi:hypothetical protein
MVKRCIMIFPQFSNIEKIEENAHPLIQWEAIVEYTLKSRWHTETISFIIGQLVKPETSRSWLCLQSFIIDNSVVKFVRLAVVAIDELTARFVVAAELNFAPPDTNFEIAADCSFLFEQCFVLAFADLFGYLLECYFVLAFAEAVEHFFALAVEVG